MRIPYIGHGADGARRSAAIDLEELDTLDLDDERRPVLEQSAQLWEAQAAALEAHHRAQTRPLDG